MLDAASYISMVQLALTYTLADKPEGKRFSLSITFHQILWRIPTPKSGMRIVLIPGSRCWPIIACNSDAPIPFGESSLLYLSPVTCSVVTRTPRAETLIAWHSSQVSSLFYVTQN